MNPQLLLYSFGSASSFEGQLVGALERLESSGSFVILDALFIGSDADSGELSVVGVHGGRAGGTSAPLLLFRLDTGERRRLTEKALRDGACGIAPDAVRAIGETLPPGSAIAALLVDHRWHGVLEDALARTGGKTVSTRFVDAPELGGLVPELLAAAESVVS